MKYLTAYLAFVLLCSPALAQPPSRARQAAERFFRTNDKNQDGKLSEEEFPQRNRRLFPLIDKNKDGFLTLDEDIAFRQRRNQGQNQPEGLPKGTKVERNLVYATVGKRKLLLDLYVPAAKKALPVVMWIHGGGWRNGKKGTAGPARLLIARGYAVVDVEYRLSGEAIFPAQVTDCKAAVRWIRANAEKHGLDADRIGVWGGSAGGHLVAFLGTSGDVAEFETEAHGTFSSRVQAVCDWFGPTDFLQMDAHRIEGSRLVHNDANSPESQLVGGPIEKEPFRSVVRKANPITYVSKDDPPFLIVHGDKDLLVPAHQSELLHAALKKAGVDSTLQIVRGAGHGLRGGETTRDQLVEMTGRFFDEHLKPSKK